MAIKDYSTDPDLNVQISGINIAEGCPPSGINNAIRQLMADVKEEQEERDTTQAAKDAAQDEAIAEAKSSAEAASEDVTALDTALRQLIAEELQKYLPLAGGNITGPLKAAPGIYAITSQTADSYFRILGGTSPGNGANLDLYGGDGEGSGKFILRARNSSGYKALDGNIDGLLTWVGNPVLTLVTSWRSGANWYRKWSDGWIEQGGQVNANATYTYPISFSDANYTLVTSPRTSTSGNEMTWTQATPQSLTATSFKAPAGGTGFQFYACGF